MEQDRTLYKVYLSLSARELYTAIMCMENYLAVNPHQINSDRLFAIKTDYQVMQDYWRRGYKDPQLPQLYDKLLYRMYVLYANVSTNHRVLHSPFMSGLFMRTHLSPRDWSVQIMREQLESFVSDVAMLDLEPPHTSQERRKELFSQHHKLIGDIFAHILISEIWTDGQGEAMEQLLLSPTVDSIDQQIIVSAITLAAMNCFDMAKFRTLMHVYQQSSDEHVRQRALVGWVFCIDNELYGSLFPEMEELIKQALEDPNCGKELAELQRQVYYCMSAEEDRETIQNEIMPDLIKNQANISRNGILEQDEESVLNDILHPGEEEENLEKMESSLRRMIDMQKQGSDVYFGGFSQMKRFPFFSEIHNWFTPFYYDHPAISQSREKFNEVKFLKAIVDYAPFCNSDKYSFALVFESVLRQIPEQVREMLNRGEAQMVQKLGANELSSPAYIRRTYLQDFFRFFRLYSQRIEFRDFFTNNERRCMFFHYPIFLSTNLQSHFFDLVTFLVKRNRKDDASLLLGDINEDVCDTYDYHMLCAYLDEEPEKHYKRALELSPNNERALWGLAKEMFGNEKYQESLDIYNQLVEINPDKKSYQLNKAVCLTNLYRYDEAEQILFRLNYENSDDLNVARVLAWALTCDDKFEQAGRLYEQIMAEEAPTEGDYLNYGFYLWFTGRIDEAANCFREVQNVYGLITDESNLLYKNGIIAEEINMMFDMIRA